MTTVGSVFIKFLADTTGFGKEAAKGVEDGLKETEKPVKETTDKISAEFAKVGKAIATAFVTKEIINFAKDSIAAAEAAETSRARIEQIATSMNLFGNEVGQVTDRLVEYAETTARQTGIDDDQIQLAQAKLLTFKNLAVTADEMGGAFDRATQAAIDMSAAGFGDAAQNAVQLGKALQDPIKGITALARSGITFTAEQKNVIRSLVETNQVAAAQDLILKAIEQQVGGTAVATANASDKMKVAYEELQEEVGGALLPAFQSLTSVLSTITRAFGALPDELQTIISVVGISTAITSGFARTLTNLGIAAGVAKGAMGVLNVAMIAYTLYSKQQADNTANWQKALQNLTRATDDQIRAMLEQVTVAGQLLGKSPAKFFEELAQTSLGTAQRILELGLAQDVMGLSTDEAIAIINKETDALKQQQADLERGAALTGSASGAADGLAGSQDDLASSTSAANAELERQAQALQRAMDAAIASFSTEIQVEQAKRRTNDAIAEYNTLVEQLATGTYTGSDAFLDLATTSENARQAALDQAAAVAQLAFEQAVAAGATEESIDKSALFKDALEQIAGTLAPGSKLRKDLEGYIRQLNSIERQIVTEIVTRYRSEGSLATPDRIERRLASGGIVGSPQVALIGEAGPEVVIPLTRPQRAMELMRQTGLDSMMTVRTTSSAAVNIESANFYNGTDANLVAQKVNAAERARSFST